MKGLHLVSRSVCFLLFAAAGASVGAYITTPAYPPLWSLPLVHGIEDQIILEAMEQGLPPHIALNTAWRESQFINSGKPSPTDDWGLFQLHRFYYPTAPTMTNAENIRAGVALLEKYWLVCHDETIVWLAFNEGPKALYRKRVSR